MNENTRTGIFAGLAVVIVAAAFITKPSDLDVRLDDMEGAALFEEFTDAAAAGRLEIVTYNEKLGKLRPFEVKRQSSGQWIIPPSEYPADNQQQLADVLTSMIGLKVVGVHSEAVSDHQECRVIEPDIDELSTATEGVGTLVRVWDDSNSELAGLIIGDEVPGQEGLRYTRLPGNNVIYVVRLDTTKLKTDFTDWIDTDLLDLASFDIRKVLLKDYAIIPGQQGLRLQQKSDIHLRWDADESNWVLDSMIEYKGDEQTPTELGLLEDEELNAQSLNDLKFALDDLKIDSVERKPEGLGADLAVEADLATNPDGIRSLQQLGFFPVARSEGENFELLSANGEMHISLQNGVQYVLRFGEIVGDISADADDIQRYMVVTARLDESMLVPPSLDPPPPAEDAPAEEPADEPPADGDKPADEGDTPADEGDKPASDKPAEADDNGCQDEPAENSTDDEPATEEGDDEPSDVDAAAEAEKARQAEFEMQLAEHGQKRNDAIQRVQVLNERFAEWYYLISEETYNKLRLGISDIVKAKEDSDGGLGNFRDLESSGLLPPPPGLPQP